MNNANLCRAKIAKNDEFYTKYEDIEKEIERYKPCFMGKAVYCNCDHPDQSEFYRYFKANFTALGLRRLIASFYDDSYIEALWNHRKGSKAFYRVFDGKTEKDVPFRKNGSFSSKESIQLLRETDRVCTNPPFSLFRRFLDLLIRENKEFLVLGSLNGFVYKNILPFLLEEDITVDEAGTMTFMTPEGKESSEFNNICWYTNLYRDRSGDYLIPTKEFREENYLRFVNYNAIMIDRLSDIPKDYKGVMAVPLTFLYYADFSEYRLMGITSRNIGKPLGKEFIDLYYSQGNKGDYNPNMRILGIIDKRGKARIPYQRFLIQKR